MRKNKSIAQYPYIVWSIIFIVVPLFLVLYYSLINSNGDVTFENYKKIFQPNNIKVFLNSIKLASISTILCLVLGYPVAYILSKVNQKYRTLLIFAFSYPNVDELSFKNLCLDVYHRKKWYFKFFS